jgi:hypothetical protein
LDDNSSLAWCATVVSMTDEQLEELWAHIGNVIRLAAAVELTEARSACEAAEIAALHAVLLEPKLAPITPRDHVINHRLLEAFVAFRCRIELIRETPAQELADA